MFSVFGLCFLLYYLKLSSGSGFWTYVNLLPDRFILFHSEEILESFSSHPPFLFPTSDYLLDLEADTPHPVVKKALDVLKSSFGNDSTLTASTLRNPQVLIEGPDSDFPSRHSTPASSVKSSSPTPAASPRRLAQTFSSSDPTLNNVDPNRLSHRLKNHGKRKIF